MPRKPDTGQAARAFEAFTGHKARQVQRARLDDGDVAGWKLGPMVGVAYEATRDGQTRQYFHEFGKKSRPDLVARADGRQLYISGGRYQVTARGVEDMSSLFVVNPSPRAFGRGRHKRKAAPMAARRRRRATRRRAPRQQVAVFRANPTRRRRPRRASSRRRAYAFARNPAPRRRRAARTVRRYRRNPSARGMAVNFGKMILPAAGIGAGAVLSEIAMGYMPIPAHLKTGVARHITKGAIGIGLGMVVAKGLRMKRLGNFMALGAVAIATHDAIKELINKQMPAIPFGRYGMYVDPIPSSMSGIGYASPAQTLRLSGMGEYVDDFPSSIATGGAEFGV